MSKRTKTTQKFKVTAKYTTGKGLRWKVGTWFLAVGTWLVSSKVTLYIEKTKVGELTPDGK